MKLEGKIAGPWVPEFNRVWESLSSSLGKKSLSIDLSGVTYVDSSGGTLLSQIYGKTGAVFVADTPLTKYFAEEATKGNHKNGRERT